MQTFDFPTAQRRMAQNAVVARQAWVLGEYAFLGIPNCVKAGEPALAKLQTDGIRSFAEMRGCYWFRDGDVKLHAGWVPTKVEQIATDWYVVAL